MKKLLKNMNANFSLKKNHKKKLSKIYGVDIDGNSRARLWVLVSKNGGNKHDIATAKELELAAYTKNRPEKIWVEFCNAYDKQRETLGLKRIILSHFYERRNKLSKTKKETVTAISSIMNEDVRGQNYQYKSENRPESLFYLTNAEFARLYCADYPIPIELINKNAIAVNSSVRLKRITELADQCKGLISSLDCLHELNRDRRTDEIIGKLGIKVNSILNDTMALVAVDNRI